MDNKKNRTNSRIVKRETKNSSSDVFASCSFASLGLHPNLCDQLKERLGFETPTQVQAKAIPVVLSGRHVLVNAATGTGKTIAYLAPIIHHLQSYEQKIQRTDGTFGTNILLKNAPRVFTYSIEQKLDMLAATVYEILVKLLHRFHWIVPGYLMGGENRSKEKARLRKGISILIATPGRLLDHLKNTASFVHTNLRWIIFDEADRILELGYGKDIEEIINRLGTQEDESLNNGIRKQNLLLSATLNEKVNQLAKISLENPVLIGIDDRKKLQDVTYNQATSDTGDKMEEPLKMSSSPSEGYKLPDQLVQRYIKVSCGSRLVVLLSILKHLFESEASQKIVVFFSTCDAVDFHHSLLKDFKWSLSQSSETEATKQLFLRCNTLKLHGNMNNEERKTSYQTFKTEKSALLLSTDVAARGLDIPKVRCIIQYDSPGEATEYVHRVGRTARLGANGEALLFLQPIEIDYLKDLEKHGVILQEYPLLKVLATFPLYSFKNQQGRKFDSIEMHPWVLTLQRALESFISSEIKMRNLAQDAFCSWVRAYTAHRGDLKNIFTVKKLHLGHVAKSFALKEQPSLVNKSIQKQLKKRKRNDKQMTRPKKKKFNTKP